MTSNVKRELVYLIQLRILTSQKIAVVSLFSNNVQYQLLKHRSVMGPPKGAPWILFQTQRR